VRHVAAVVIDTSVSEALGQLVDGWGSVVVCFTELTAGIWLLRLGVLDLGRGERAALRNVHGHALRVALAASGR